MPFEVDVKYMFNFLPAWGIASAACQVVSAEEPMGATHR